MIKLRIAFLVAVSVCLAFLVPQAETSAFGGKNDLGIIARLTANLLEKDHFRNDLDEEEISGKLFDEYFKNLDPSKIYFSAEDLKKFESSKKQLNAQIIEGNLGFSREVFNLLLAKIAAFNKFAEELIAKKPEFTGDEEFIADRSKMPWTASDAELKILWTQRIKNDLLMEKMMRRAQIEDAEKNKDKEDAAKKENLEALWGGKTPEEKLLKRYSNNLKYLSEYDEIDITEAYLTALANVYDPHSSYMSQKSMEDFNIQMGLSLVGIGATLQAEDGYTKVISLVPGGPADLDGRIEPEDRIIAVAQGGDEAVDVIDMPLNKVVRLIRGKEKTEVRLSILKGSKGLYSVPELVTLTREKVKLKDSEAKSEIRDTTPIVTANDGKSKIAIVSLPSFYYDFDAASNGERDFKSSTDDLKKILMELSTKNIDGMILDMRSNGGGSLLEAIRVSGLFITKGPVVQVKGRNSVAEIKNDSDEKIYYGGPLVVLVNRFSASATEIFAGAIQDYGRGIIVGDTHTHGKGTVQEIRDLKEYLRYFMIKSPGNLRITTQKFYRINGASTQLRGVSPDIVFPSFTDYMETDEKSLDNALPWDEIASLKFDKFQNLEKTIPLLNAEYMKRRAASDEFKTLEKNIAVYKKFKDEKSISLNEKKRWDMYMETKKINDLQTALIKYDEDSGDESQDKKKTKDKGKEKQNDLYLDEAIRILGDYIRLGPKPPEGITGK